MITHYTLLSHLTDGTHRIMRGLKLTPARAKQLAREWTKDSGGTRYTILPATDYAA
jgi:hypothetical protein